MHAGSRPEQRGSRPEQPEEAGLRFYPPDEALEHARPLPTHDRLVIEDVPYQEWEAFQAAIADT